VVLKDYPPPPEWATLARLAALHLTDGGAAVLPWGGAVKLLRSADEVAELREQGGKPGYELLLWHIGEVTFNWPIYDAVRRILVAGAGLDDVNWWGDRLQKRLAENADPFGSS